MAKDSWIGKTLSNRYLLTEQLGKGGMSAVYKANDPNLRRTVAIKMIHEHLTDNPEFMRRFEEEAAAVAQLRHPNIVQVYDFNHDDQVYYMVLEFLPGETFEAHLRRMAAQNRRMGLVSVTLYLAQVCDAVQYAHDHGVIHRDIKPANIMMNIYDQAVLMDFGISRIVGGQMKTAAGAVIGTASYMSPEQIKGERVDERADIYALGVTLFEMVSGKPPFVADSAMTLMMMHLNDPVPDIRQLRPAVPEDLIAVIEKALAKNRDDRYQTAAEMAGVLRQVQARLMKAELPGSTEIKGPERPSLQATQVETYTPEPAASAEHAAIGSVPVNAHSHASNQVNPQQVSPIPVDQPAGKQAAANKRPRVVWYALGCLAVFLVLLLAGAFGALSLLRGTQAGRISGLLAGLQATPTGPASAGLAPTGLVAITGKETLSASTQAPAVVLPQAATASETPAPPPTATLPAPAATLPAGQPFVQIISIGVENGRYVVEYETSEFIEQLNQTHIHFFFNTVSFENAGMPGKGPWVLYGGPRPFRGMSVASRAPQATQICALVANPDHSVQANSGNCIELPAP